MCKLKGIKPLPYTSYVLSESAISLEYGGDPSIEQHQHLLGWMQAISDQPFEGFRDLTIAYCSLTVFFDPLVVHRSYRQSPLQFVQDWLEKLIDSSPCALPEPGKEFQIPVCYEAPFAPDLEAMAEFHKCSSQSLIDLHCSVLYYVFMIGYNPGFPYLGIVPPGLQTPRKHTPLVRVPAGSVGIAGQQTGIYPATTPGGWNIIGRSPKLLFDMKDPELCLLKAGDRVRFSPIDSATFKYLSQYEDP